MTAPEAYEALQRGQVDCTIASQGWLDAMSLADVVQYLNTSIVGSYAGGVLLSMNTDRWNALTQEQRGLFLKHAAEAVMDVAMAVDEADRVAVERAVEAGKLQTVDATDDFKALDAAHRQGEIERVVRMAERRKVQDVRPLLEKFESLLVKWDAIYDEVGGDREKFQQRLHEDVFAKVAH